MSNESESELTINQNKTESKVGLPSTGIALEKDRPEIRFSIAYDGDDHVKHQIDVKMLGDSLISLASVLHTSAEIATGDPSSIDVKISADFKAGSFGVEFLVIHALDALPMLKALGVVGGSAVASATALGVIQALRGRKIEVDETVDGGDHVLRVDNEEIPCSELVAKIVTNKTVRQGLETVIRKPLERPGTNSFKISSNLSGMSKEIFEVNSEDAESFQKLLAAETKKSTPEEIKVRFVAADIEKNMGWRIDHDGRILKVLMNDKQFVERLQNMKEPHLFGRDFRVRLETIKKTKLGKDGYSRRITHVRTSADGK